MADLALFNVCNCIFPCIALISLSNGMFNAKSCSADQMPRMQLKFFNQGYEKKELEYYINREVTLFYLAVKCKSFNRAACARASGQTTFAITEASQLFAFTLFSTSVMKITK